MKLRNETLFSKYVTIFLVVAGYWIISIATVFVNKALLSGIHLEAPIFIVFTQTIITVLICYTKKVLSKVFPQFCTFPDVNVFSIETLQDVLPLSIMFVSMITWNNLCLKYVSVAFYYIGRSLTTIFNVIFTYLILREKTSRGCIFFCVLIVIGFYLGVDQENLAGSLSVRGTIFGVLGSVSLSLYSIFTKKVLPKVNHEVWTLSYCNNVYASIILIPMMIMNGEFAELQNYEQLWNKEFWAVLIIGGFCGFAIGFFTSLQIKVTSALTHNISGTAKACAQTILATYWFNEAKSWLWWFSNAVVLVGSAGYARLRQLEMERKHRESPIYQKTNEDVDLVRFQVQCVKYKRKRKHEIH